MKTKHPWRYEVLTYSYTWYFGPLCSWKVMILAVECIGMVSLSMYPRDAYEGTKIDLAVLLNDMKAVWNIPGSMSCCHVHMLVILVSFVAEMTNYRSRWSWGGFILHTPQRSSERGKDWPYQLSKLHEKKFEPFMQQWGAVILLWLIFLLILLLERPWEHLSALEWYHGTHTSGSWKLRKGQSWALPSFYKV